MDPEELDNNLLLQDVFSGDDQEDTYSHSFTLSPLESRDSRLSHPALPLDPASSSSSSSASLLVAVNTASSLKRSRALSSPTTSAAFLHNPKSRRHAEPPQSNARPTHNQPGSSTGSSNSDLLGLFGLEEDDDFRAVEEEQRKAETWLQQRREQEREDEEFARALQAAWGDTLNASSDSEGLNDLGSQPSSYGQPRAQGQQLEYIQPHTQYATQDQPRRPYQSQAQGGHQRHDREYLRPQYAAQSQTHGAMQQYPSSTFGHGQTGMMLPPPLGGLASSSSSKPSWTPPTAHGSSSRNNFGSSQPTGSYQKAGSIAKPENYIELSSDSEPEELDPLATSRISDPWATQSFPPGNSLSGSLPYSNLPHQQFISPYVEAMYRQKAMMEYPNNGLPILPSLPQHFLSSIAGPCPPGCDCEGKGPHYATASWQIDNFQDSQLNSLRNMYAHDGLTADEMKKELKSLLENIRPDLELDLNREETPESLRFPLMKHQALGLAWMKSMEEGSNKGGILADDMGLGKTMQALALMVSRPSTDPLRKTTLIIAPVALIQQWKREIGRMLKSGEGHQLSVFVLHGDRKSVTFSDLRRHDVVLTTFGTLASELKRKEKWAIFKKENPNVYQNLRAPIEEMPILGDECKWYRIIIDEAQCIKNRNTKGAQACYALQSIYRWCMSGTPMMNNVQELYSLIHFLRIGPYNKLDRFNSTFTRPLKNEENAVQSNAMKKLQALLKAVLLRRLKTSEIDGKPILQLPPRVIEKVHTVFSEDEQNFYQALETKSQLQFNRYLAAGTVGRNYSNVLVLLLRLRQACCHPHLIRDFAVKTGSTAEDLDLIANAKLLDNTVIERLKSQEASECPVCIDVAENAVIFFPCGHSTCAECFARISDPSRGLAQGNDGLFEVKCPTCRGKVDPKKVTDYSSFQKVHISGEDAPEDDKQGEQADVDTDDSDSDSEDDRRGTLNGFIVRDDFDQSRKSKGKGKAKVKKSLAQLKKDSHRNAKAKRKYLRALSKRWQPSAKVDKTIEILQSLRDSGSNEKTIVFSQFTSLLDLIEVPINNRGWSYCRYDGSMKPADRNDSVLDFTDNPECRVMLVSLKAGNAGLNLVAASQVIILDPFWNPYIEDQAIDRAHRIGQLRPVMVHRLLVENTVEDRIIELQDKKREIIEGALDEKASMSVGRLGVQELAFLFNGHQ